MIVAEITPLKGGNHIMKVVIVGGVAGGDQTGNCGQQYGDDHQDNGSNGMQIYVTGNSERMLLMASYDNLGKGASGAAVQNLNIVLGAEETAGLLQSCRRKGIVRLKENI